MPAIVLKTGTWTDKYKPHLTLVFVRTYNKNVVAKCFKDVNKYFTEHNISIIKWNFKHRELWGRSSLLLKGDIVNVVNALRQHLSQMNYAYCLEFRPAHIDVDGNLDEKLDEIFYTTSLQII
jgi:hypothetical protein